MPTANNMCCFINHIVQFCQNEAKYQRKKKNKEPVNIAKLNKNIDQNDNNHVFRANLEASNLKDNKNNIFLLKPHSLENAIQVIFKPRHHR